MPWRIEDRACNDPWIADQFALALNRPTCDLAHASSPGKIVGYSFTSYWLWAFAVPILRTWAQLGRPPRDPATTWSKVPFNIAPRVPRLVKRPILGVTPEDVVSRCLVYPALYDR
jgi:hypothetical protein